MIRRTLRKGIFGRSHRVMIRWPQLMSTWTMNTKLPCATLVLPAVLLACVAASPLAAQGIITTLAGADWVFPGD